MAVHNVSAAKGGPAVAEPLAVEGLEVVYNNAVRALAGVTIEVPSGAFVAVLGANGAGKTTLVRAITGLLYLHGGKVTEGSMRLGDTVISGASAGAVVRHGVAQVMEGRKLFARLTVEDNLLCGAASRRDKAIRSDLDRVWELFPVLHDRRKSTAGYLSGGEQQMVAVGRALMAKPRLLICDELSLGLAPLIVRQLFGQLQRINTDDGVSVLVIEQNARIALQHASYGYVIETGRVVSEGTSAHLQADEHVQEYYLGGSGDAREAYEAVKRYKTRRQVV